MTTLRPCPFCGAAARVEAHPEHADILRVACGGEECAIRPATEYLLEEFRAELAAAWNGRHGERAAGCEGGWAGVLRAIAAGGAAT